MLQAKLRTSVVQLREELGRRQQEAENKDTRIVLLEQQLGKRLDESIMPDGSQSDQERWALRLRVQEMEDQLATYRDVVEGLRHTVERKDGSFQRLRQDFEEKREEDRFQQDLFYSDTTVGQMRVWLKFARRRQVVGGLVALRKFLGKRIAVLIRRWWAMRLEVREKAAIMRHEKKGAVQAAVVLDMDFSKVGQPGSYERRKFESSLHSDLCQSLGVRRDLVEIRGLSAGSVKVNFRILPDEANLQALSPSEHRETFLKLVKDEYSALYEGSVTRWANPAKTMHESRNIISNEVIMEDAKSRGPSLSPSRGRGSLSPIRGASIEPNLQMMGSTGMDVSEINAVLATPQGAAAMVKV